MAISLCHEGERLGLTSMLVGYDPLPQDRSALPTATPFWQMDRRRHDFIENLRGLIRDEKVDIVHAQGHIPAVYLEQVRSGWQNAPPIIVTMHVGLQGTWRWLWQIRRALRAADHLTAVSRDMAQTYSRVTGRPVGLLANGIDFECFTGIEPTQLQPGEPIRFAMMSRLDRAKRHVDAVCADCGRPQT
jgi:hypothetical protein